MSVPTPLVDRYLAAQLAGDRRAAVRVLLEEGLASGVAIPDLYLDVIQAAQRRIGELWQRNEISIAQEHLATAISQLGLAELYRALPCSPSNHRRVVVACVEGETHDLGAQITADFFEMWGFELRYLGPNVPTRSLLGIVSEYAPDLLVLSVTMSTHLEPMLGAVRLLRDSVGNGLRLAVGGSAFGWCPGFVEVISADVYGRDARESVDLACRMLGVANGSGDPSH